MIVATTSISHFMDDLQLTQAFNVTVHVSQLQSPAEIGAVLTDYIMGDASKIGIMYIYICTSIHLILNTFVCLY
jgi:hypothetical protein